MQGQHAYTLLFTACQQSPNFIFWAHSRNNFNKRFADSFVADDGVHVHPVRGMPRYFMSVRSALLFAERRLPCDAQHIQ